MKDVVISGIVMGCICLCSFQGHEKLSALSFSIVRGSSEVGHLNITRKIEGDRDTYSLSSHVNVKLFFEIQILENIKDVFESGSLVSSTQQRFVDGDQKVSNSLVRTRHGYEVTDQNGCVKMLMGSIEESILSLYFKEPKNGQWVYSENFKRLLQVQELDAERYQIELPNGYSTVYTYGNGFLKTVVSNSHVGKIKFIKRDSNAIGN